MFDYDYIPANYDPIGFWFWLFIVVFLLLFSAGHNLICLRSSDKDRKLGKIEPRNKPNKLCKLKHSKILFLFFYKKEEGISEEIYHPTIRSYFYCLLVVLSIVAHIIFYTIVTVTIGLILAFVNLFIVPIDMMIAEHIENKKRKESTTKS